MTTDRGEELSAEEREALWDCAVGMQPGAHQRFDPVLAHRRLVAVVERIIAARATASAEEVDRLRAERNAAIRDLAQERVQHPTRLLQRAEQAEAEIERLRHRAEEAEAGEERWIDRHAETEADVKRLRAEMTAILDAQSPACWLLRSSSISCLNLVGGKVGPSSAEVMFTEEMCCMPCRLRAVLDASNLGVRDG